MGEKTYIIEYPNLIKAWDWDKNNELNLFPSELSTGSNKKAWWKCSLGHEWQATISSRVAGRGCPFCSNRKVLPGFNDLATIRPFLVQEWNTDKNGTLTPTTVLAGSYKKVWWKCAYGHEWQAAIAHRTYRNQGCPYCSGRRVIAGTTDLATLNPKLAKEWHPTKNGSLMPNQVTIHSGKKIWWLCANGHEWLASPHDRDGDRTNCPICNVRRQTSFAEQAIFYYIKKYFPDAINKYRDIFSNTMELDIYIPSKSIGIEYDGINWHKTEKEYRRERKKYQICKNKNIFLIRLKENSKIVWDDVADKIFYIDKTRNYKKLNHLILILLDYINSLIQKEDLFTVFLVDIEKDKNEIECYLNEIQNSLADLKPDLIEEWNYEKNGRLKPEMFSLHSNEIVWWKCKKCGHVWKTSINRRTGKIGSGCALCGNIKKGKSFHSGYLSVNGSLAQNNPELAQEWHPFKNDMTPYDITSASPIKVWWRCKNCGYEWSASPNNRSRGVGCPCCSGRVPKIGVNDLATVDPVLASEWHTEKNTPLQPNMVLPKSGKKVWWKCKICGYEWQAAPHSRSAGHGCPCCSGRVPKSGTNDLATVYPQLACQWHPTKNGSLSPSMVLSQSSKKVWWLCPQCGYEWQAVICKRLNRSCCPNCKK